MLNLSRNAPRNIPSKSSNKSAKVQLAIASALLLAACGCGGGPAYPAAGVYFGPGGIYGPGYGYGYISTAVGDGQKGYSGNGGVATSAQLRDPSAVVADGTGNLYVADTADNVIRKVSSTGVISTVAGVYDGAFNGGYSGDNGVAASARLNGPSALAVDASGNLYIADSGNNVVRKVNVSTGIISTIVGNGYSGGSAYGGYAGDNGPATRAELNRPVGIAFDASGNLYVADSLNNAIRKVDASTGVIATVAGDGTRGFAGDGGLATSAQLSNPRGIAVDTAGNLYIADSANNVIRKVTSATGAISTAVGNGKAGYFGDGGVATSAILNNPTGVALDAAGNLYIADTSNMRVRRADTTTDVITTVAGMSKPGYAGDGGSAASAEMNNPWNVAFDGSGNMYIADSANNVVRKVAPTP